MTEYKKTPVNRRRVSMCVPPLSLWLQLSLECQRIAPALWQMRKATAALVKVTGQMEAIPPEAWESSCDRGMPRCSRQDSLSVFVFLCTTGYQDLTYRTICIFLLAHGPPGRNVCHWCIGNPTTFITPHTFTWGEFCHVCLFYPGMFCLQTPN